MVLLSDKILARLLDAAPDAMIAFDREQYIVMSNLQAENLFGCRRNGLIGRPVDALIQGEIKGGPSDCTVLLLSARRLDGVEFPAEISLSTIKNESHPIVTATIRDVSARSELEAERVRVKTEAERVRVEAQVALVKAEDQKAVAERVRIEAEAELITAEDQKAVAERVRFRAEAELERLHGLLNQSQRMESLGQLAGSVAHDFNNLLSVILNYASFVEEELSKAVATENGAKWEGSLNDVKQIQLATDRACELTHQLLAFARREVLQARPLSINDAITNMEEILRLTIGEQIELTIKLGPDLAMVVADPGHIEQMILNFVINARDAMPSGGTLLIETSSRFITAEEWSTYGAPEGSYICFRISDNGVGMSPTVRDRAFEPFFTTKPRGEGTGLGLATVYGIVLQSGGFTRIYSDEGIGTTITVLLPINLNQGDIGEREEQPVVAHTSKGTETILVVDDEDDLREVTRRILARNGYTVLTARSGEEAIEIATTYEDTIDLLLSDVIMAKMKGPTVAKKIKKIVPGIRVLFMSGHAQPVLEAESVIGTQFQLVEKPFDQSMLLKSVRNVLDADLTTMEQKT